MKKLVFCCGIVVLLLTGCANGGNSSLADKPNFSATVEKVYEGSILVYVDEGEDERRSCDKISVPLETEEQNSQTSFVVGDKVRIYYDGIIAESYPGQINNPYAIEKINSSSDTSWDNSNIFSKKNKKEPDHQNEYLVLFKFRISCICSNCLNLFQPG